MDEKKLIAHLNCGKTSALEEIIRLYTPYISVILYNMGISAEDGEEIASDVFTALWRSRERIDAEYGSIKPYLASITRNFALKRLSRKRLECVPLAETADVSEGEGDFLWDAVMLLGEPDSEIFVRHYKYGEKHRETAQAVGMSVSAVKQRIARGKIKLKKILEGYE